MYIPCETSSWTLLHQNRKLSSRISLQNRLFCLCRLPAVVVQTLKCQMSSWERVANLTLYMSCDNDVRRHCVAGNLLKTISKWVHVQCINFVLYIPRVLRINLFKQTNSLMNICFVTEMKWFTFVMKLKLCCTMV
jgi:hypothetical protein